MSSNNGLPQFFIIVFRTSRLTKCFHSFFATGFTTEWPTFIFIPLYYWISRPSILSPPAALVYFGNLPPHTHGLWWLLWSKLWFLIHLTNSSDQITAEHYWLPPPCSKWTSGASYSSMVRVHTLFLVKCQFVFFSAFVLTYALNFSMHLVIIA